MVQSYDFDIQWLVPSEVDADPAITELLSDIGLNGNPHGNYIALFRDPQVTAMIERADPVLRDYLKSSGFGFIPYQSGAPAGFFPAADEPARTDVVARLDENLGRFALVGSDLGGFDFAAFLRTIAEGQPLSTSETSGSAPPTATPRPQANIDFLATPTAFAKLSGRNRVMPLMVLALAATLGVFWLIERLDAATGAF